MDFGLMAEAWCEDGLLVDVDFSLWPKAARCASSCYALASLATCICIGQTETLPIIRYRCATIYCFLLYVGNKWTLFLTCKSLCLDNESGLRSSVCKPGWHDEHQLCTKHITAGRCSICI